MRCTCESCRGTGTVICPECDGQGSYIGRIETMLIEKNVQNYEELNELQKDAKRNIRLARRLIEMNPARKASYDAQLNATLEVINREADKAAERKPAA